MQEGQVSAANSTVLRQIEPVATADIDCRLLAHLHRSLRTSRFGAPHCSISAMAGLGAFDRVGDSIELCSHYSFAS